MKSIARILAILAVVALAPAARAADPAPVRIAHVYAKTGAFQAFAGQSHVGLMLGLEYATGGTMKIDGRPIVVTEKDTQLKPDLARTLLAEAFGDDNADFAVGDLASNVTIAMMPVAQDYKHILIVEPAVADSITGKDWNRYIFRTGRNSTMDAISSAVALGKPGVTIATLAQDYAYGRDGIAAFRDALKPTGATLALEEYAPFVTADFTASALRLFESLKDKPGRKIIFVLWAGSTDALAKMKDQGPERYNIELAAIGNTFAAMSGFKSLPGMEGSTFYYYGIPKNPANDWLVKTHQDRFATPPDFFVPGGMTAGMAIVAAIRKAGSTDPEKLIAAMEGLHFDTPKGEMIFRPEDHQALQVMYHFRVKIDPTLAWGVPELVREIPISEMDIPIANKR
jgi:branched-chain amino acid transport system substrate-binding protein